MGELEVEKHANYILSVEKKKDSFESVVMEHLRINGAYWGLTTLDLLGKIDAVNSEEVVSWVMKCQHESGGFGGNIGHDPHLLYTLSAIQILALFDKINILDAEKVSYYIASLQNEDGSFSGDMWGEVDTRFSYIAICSLALLHGLEKIAVEKAVKYIVSCKNLDGGFGCTPGAESHAGQSIFGIFYPAFTCSYHFYCQFVAYISILRLEVIQFVVNFFAITWISPFKSVYLGGKEGKNMHLFKMIFIELNINFLCLYDLKRCLNPEIIHKIIYTGVMAVLPAVFCCVGALAITGFLDLVDKDLLGWWLCERQVKSGGLNGRPEKLPDVCYSWWVLSSLIMIDRVHWIDKEKLVKYILDCQDKEKGGISDRPDDAVDVFHTYFGVAGLSHLEYPGLKAIDPAYALPVDVVDRIFLGR